MKHNMGKILSCFLLGILITGSLCIAVSASEDDNSLYSLGLMTDGAVVEQEVDYGVYEFDVIVPAGTDELELDPVPTNENARISSIEGTDLDENGNGTVLVTVTAPNGDPFTYTLHVTSLDAEPETQKQTEPVTEKQTEKKKKAKETEPETETEEKLYVEVPRDTVTQAQNTITELQNEIIEYRENVNLYQKIMYVLLAVAIVFLFIIINLLLRNRDLKAELKEYRSLGYVPSGKNKDRNGGSGSAGNSGNSGESTKKERKKNRAKAEEGNASQQAAAPQTAPSGQSAPASSGQQAAGQPGQGAPEAGAAPVQPVPGQSASGAAPAETHSVYYEKAPLDVTPQTSSRSRHLPEYESGQPQPAADADQKRQQPPVREQGGTDSAQAPSAPAPKKDKSGVQVDMIDL